MAPPRGGAHCVDVAGLLATEGLYPLRTLASVFVIYGVATLAHGSRFLAVFIVGIVLGDERAPFKRGSNGSTPRWPA